MTEANLKVDQAKPNQKKVEWVQLTPHYGGSPLAKDLNTIDNNDQIEENNQRQEQLHTLFTELLNLPETSYDEVRQKNFDLAVDIGRNTYELFQKIRTQFNILESSDESAQVEQALAMLRNLHDESLESALVYPTAILALIDHLVETWSVSQPTEKKLTIQKRLLKIPYFVPENQKSFPTPPDNQPKTKEAFLASEWLGRLADIKGTISGLIYQSQRGEYDVFKTMQLELAKLIQNTRQASQTYGGEAVSFVNQELAKLLDDKPEIFKYMKNDLDSAQKKDLERQRQNLETSGLLDKLTNTKDYTVFFHRTGPSAADSILKTGLGIGADGNDLQTTATASSANLEEALSIYFSDHKRYDQVVIIHVPKNSQGVTGYNLIPKETVPWDNHKQALIPPSWILGYVSRSTGEFTKNPHFGDSAYDQTKPPLPNFVKVT